MNNDSLSSVRTHIQTQFFAGQIPSTFRNMKQISEVEKPILSFQHHTYDPPQLALLHQTFRAAKLAIADHIVLNLTNAELLIANTPKK